MWYSQLDQFFGIPGENMIIQIDSTSSVPVYAQIIEQVRKGIASGLLQKGEALPSRRELALELEINPLTVLKAYKELEHEGLIQIKQGLGCFVLASSGPAVDQYRKRTLEKAIDQIVTDARAFGISMSELEDMIYERMKQEDSGEEGGLKRA